MSARAAATTAMWIVAALVVAAAIGLGRDWYSGGGIAAGLLIW